MRTGRVQGPSTSLRTKSPLQSRLCLQPCSLWQSRLHLKDPNLIRFSQYASSILENDHREAWICTCFLFSSFIFMFDQLALLQTSDFTSPVVQIRAKEPACMHAHIHSTHGRACAENICERISHPTYFCLYIHSAATRMILSSAVLNKTWGFFHYN